MEIALQNFDYNNNYTEYLERTIKKEQNAIKFYRNNSLSTESLIEALKEKKSIGYESLYDMYAKTLYGVILKIIPNIEDAEDLLSETFIKITTAFNQFDSSRGTLYTWIITIAKNLAFDKIRTKDYKNSLKNQTIENRSIEFYYNTSFNPETLDLKKVINLLKPEEKLLIDLAYFQGYTRKEIAKNLDMPVGTVKTKLRNAILSLRTIFEYNKFIKRKNRY